MAVATSTEDMAEHRSESGAGGHRLMSGRFAVAFFLVTLAASALAAYTAAALVLGSPRSVALLPLATFLGLLLAVIALYRIEIFLLTVLVLRSSLDALKLESAIIDPAAVVGLLLLSVVPLWLLLQHRSGAMRFRLTGTGVVVGGFTAASAIGIVVSRDPMSSAVEWTRIATAAAMFFGIEQIVLHRNDFKRKTLAAVFLALPIPVIASLVQLQSGQGLFEAAGFARVTGTFTHSNPFAAFLVLILVMAIPCATELRGRPRLFALLVAALAAPALLLTYTRGAWIAAFLGLVAVALVLRRLSVAAGLAAVVAVAILLVPSFSDRLAPVSDVAQEQFGGAQAQTSGEDSLAWRIGYWRQAIGLSDESPVVGIGLKQIAQTLPESKQPHNDFLRAYVELGVLGLVTFLAMILWLLQLGPSAVRRLRKEPPSAQRSRDLAIAGGFAGLAVAYTAMSITANLMSQTVVLLYVMACAALASAVAVGVRDRMATARGDQTDTSASEPAAR